MNAGRGAVLIVESGPAAMKNKTRKTSTTARASRRCTGPGDKLERKCCSSGTIAAVFAIGATLRDGRERTERSLSDQPFFPLRCLHRAHYDILDWKADHNGEM